MNRTLVYTLSVLCSLGLGFGEAAAKGKGGGKGKPSSSSSSKAKSGKGSSKGKPSSKIKGADKSKGHPGKVKVPPGKAKDHPVKGQGDKDDWRVEAKFRDKDRSDLLSIWDDYKGHPHGLPPGLAKNLRRGKPLPPGWEKKLHSGWVVDRDSWGLFDRIPGDYLPKDFKLPRGTGMFLYGDRLVRVHEPTREVIDFHRIPTIKP